MRCLISITLFIGIFGVIGCKGEFQQAIQRIDKLIEEVETARQAITLESSKWRSTLTDLEEKLEDAGARILANDLRNYTDLTIGNAGIELRCNIDFAEEKIKESLKSLREALKKKRAELSILGRLNGKIDEILASLSADLPPPSPFICHFIPEQARLQFENYEDEPDRLAVLETNTVIVSQGFGFKRPATENKAFSLAIVDVEGHSRDISNSSNFISGSTPYTLQINIGQMVNQFKATDLKLVLKWGSSLVTTIGAQPVSDIREMQQFELPIVMVNERKKRPPPPPRVVAILVDIRTANQDKDKEITFVFTVHEPGVGGLASISVNDGVWNNGDRRTVRIPIPADRTLLESERLKYALRWDYQSSDGDPNWIGAFSARAEIVHSEGTKVVEVIADTGDFEMGHYGDNPERKTRDFQFNR